MIKRTIFPLFFLLAFAAKAQVRLMVGGVAGRYNFLESQQANMAAKFNLGYDYSFDASSNSPTFSGSTDLYNVKNKMHWNQGTTGIVLGFEFQTDRIKQSLYFEGKSNSASGKRTNTTKNYEESFALKSKFGGIHYNFTYALTDRIGFFYDLGFTRYCIKFSADSPNSEQFKHERMGYKLHFLSGKYTPGDKSINVVNGFGIDFALISSDKLEVSLRPEIGFAVNEMSEINLGLLYSRWVFNLNYIQCGLIIKPILSE